MHAKTIFQKIRLVAFLLVALLPAWTTVLATPPASAASRHVIVITIDGLRPQHYQDAAYRKSAPNLVQLAEQGTQARSAVAAYPSATYPGHANIITGVRPARHRITGNSVFRPPQVEGRGFWYARDMKAPALWDYVKPAGYTVASLSWPCSADTPNIDWNFPEFWSSPFGAEVNHVRRFATPEILAMVERLKGSGWPSLLAHSRKRDLMLTMLAEELVRTVKPNLLLLHLVDMDKTQHRYGPAASQVRGALAYADELVGRIRKAVHDAGLDDQTTWFIMGDHGFAAVEHSVSPNHLLAENGFITLENGEIKAWQALVYSVGGAAFVHLRNPEDRDTAGAVRQLLERNSEDEQGEIYYRLVEQKQMDAMGAAPDADFALEADPSYMFSGTLVGPFIRRASLRGNHGYMPTRQAMKAGFIAAGRGVKRKSLVEIQLVDVSPTIAALMGLEMPDAEGRVLKEILE
jgi:predicted AlkP superfamily pyrophosphatase or phosphodiesterase